VTARLTDKTGICVYLGNIAAATYDTWRERGLVPGPVPGTTRYDIKAHDAALDRAQGIDHVQALSPVDVWEREHGEAA
jgi:hypothetical protein